MESDPTTERYKGDRSLGVRSPFQCTYLANSTLKRLIAPNPLFL
ncbi:hypothetical protein [Nostoc sp. 2RC]|nr:hypothetical protein [Nostoc sp. 2RC]